MTCCEDPQVRHDDTHTKATCRTCGFTWIFGLQGKGRFKSKKPKWGPKWFCSDDYDRGWRMRGYEKHEVVGTRRRGNLQQYVIGCSQSMNTFTVDEDSPPSDVYCPFCDRSGPFGPMVKRYQFRREAET